MKNTHVEKSKLAKLELIASSHSENVYQYFC